MNSDFSLPGYPNVFVVGDMASFEIATGSAAAGRGAGRPSRRAGTPPAMILRDLVGEPRSPFHYNDKAAGDDRQEPARWQQWAASR